MKSLLNRFFIFVFCFRQQPFYSTELNSTSETKSCQCRAEVELQSSQLSTAIARRLKQALATILLMTLLEFLFVETMVSVLHVNLLCCRVAFVLSF